MSWQEVVFESLYSEDSRNGVYKPKEFHGSGIKVVNMGELFGYDRIGDQQMSLVRLTEHEIKKSSLLDGDLLFGRRSIVEEGAGKCSLVLKPTQPMTFESSIIRVRLKQEIADPQFYYYYFKSTVGRSRVMAIVNGVTVKGIRGSELKKILVHRPPVNEQIRIREILSTYDDLIAANQRRIQLLEESARLLYREWFVKLQFPGHETVPVADGVPEGWAKMPLEELAEVVMGQSPESKFFNEDGEGLPFHQGVTNFGERYVTHSIFSTHATRIAQTGDILCSVRAPVGRLNITLDKIVIGRGLSAMRSKKGTQSLLFYQLKNLFFQENLIGGGAIFASVGKKELFGQELSQPSETIAFAFEKFASGVDQQIEAITLQMRRLQEARDLLLPKLMSGALDVSGIAAPKEAAA